MMNRAVVEELTKSSFASVIADSRRLDQIFIRLASRFLLAEFRRSLQA